MPDWFYSEAVSKVLLSPPAPKWGFVKCLYINKSPLGDLGANNDRWGFDTASFVAISNYPTVPPMRIPAAFHALHQK